MSRLPWGLSLLISSGLFLITMYFWNKATPFFYCSFPNKQTNQKQILVLLSANTREMRLVRRKWQRLALWWICIMNSQIFTESFAKDLDTEMNRTQSQLYGTSQPTEIKPLHVRAEPVWPARTWYSQQKIFAKVFHLPRFSSGNLPLSVPGEEIIFILYKAYCMKPHTLIRKQRISGLERTMRFLCSCNFC